MKKIGLILVSAILISMLCACTANSEKALIGKWDRTDSILSYEFCADGSAFLYTNNNISYSGTYSFPNENRLKIDFPSGGTEVFDFEINGNELLLTDKNHSSNKTETYIKSE